MIDLMRKRSATLASRLAVVLVLVLLAGVLLAVLIRKKQSLQEMVSYHTKIKANLAAMQENNRLLQGQIAGFRSELTIDERQSRDVQIFSRLDQLQRELKPLNLQLTPLEIKEAAARVGFTLKLSQTQYDRAINTLGRLQNESLPLITFSAIKLSAPPNSDFTVEGSVVMPAQLGTQP